MAQMFFGPPQWAVEIAFEIRKDLSKLMALVTVDSTKIDAVNAALATLTTETSTALADIAAEITALKNNTPDPTTATELDSILTSVNAMGTSIKAADPGPITTAPPPAA